MARIISDKEKSLLIADYKTGKFSQRELSKKHNMSIGTVNNITKDLEATNEHLVNAQIALLTAKEILPNEQMNAVMNTAQDIIRREGLIFNNAELLAGKIAIMADQIDTPSDLKILSEANDRLAITLKVAERHAPKGDVNVQTNTQVNNIKSFEDFYDE